MKTQKILTYPRVCTFSLADPCNLQTPANGNNYGSISISHLASQVVESNCSTALSNRVPPCCTIYVSSSAGVLEDYFLDTSCFHIQSIEARLSVHQFTSNTYKNVLIISPAQTEKVVSGILTRTRHLLLDSAKKSTNSIKNLIELSVIVENNSLKDDGLPEGATTIQLRS